LAVVAIYLATFSKELAIMTPVVFVVLDLYTRRQTERSSLLADFRQLCAERKVLYGFLAVVMVCLAGAILFLSPDVNISGSPGFYDTSGQGLGVVERMGLAGLGLRLLLVPLGQSVDYSFDALGFTAGGLRPLELIDLGLLMLGIALCVWGLARRNWAGFAGLWFVLYYLPHMGIIPWHEVFAERFLYLSSIGFCVAMAAAGTWLASRWKRPTAVVGVMILLLLTVGTVQRNEVWGSSVALWESAVERYPSCARAHKALGDAYIAETRPDLALGHYQEAVKIFPNYLDARTGIAVAYTARRQYALALETLEETLERWPNDAKTLNAQAYLHETLGNPEAAMEAYERAVSSDPSFADGYNNLGRLYVQKGDLDTAIRMYEKALEHNPAMVTALRNLAVVYREGLGDVEKAESYEAQARKLDVTR
jgi:Tfp pilus assembly protein PilF